MSSGSEIGKHIVINLVDEGSNEAFDSVKIGRDKVPMKRKYNPDSNSDPTVCIHDGGESEASKEVKRKRLEKSQFMVFGEEGEEGEADDINPFPSSSKSLLNRELLPKHLRKALKYVLATNTHVSESIAKQAVKNHNAANPHDKNCDSISNGALTLIKNGFNSNFTDSSEPSLRSDQSLEDPLQSNADLGFAVLAASVNENNKPDEALITIIDDNHALLSEDKQKENSQLMKTFSIPTYTGKVVTTIDLVDNDDKHIHHKHHDLSVIDSESDVHRDDQSDVVEILDVYNPLNEVLKIFPTAKSAFVEKLLARFCNNVELVAQEMLEKGYDKETRSKPSEMNGGSTSNQRKEYDFLSSSWDTSPQYRKHAFVELINNFPYFKEAFIKRVFEGAGKKHYYHTVKLLEEISNEKRYELIENFPCTSENIVDKSSIKKAKSKQSKIHDPSQRDRVKNYIMDNYQRIQNILGDMTIQVSDFGVRSAVKSTLQKPIYPLDDVLAEELRWLKQKELKDLSEADHKLAEELNTEFATADGAMLECGCCFGEFPFEALIQCSDGHLFCKNCLKHYVEETVFGGGRSNIKCMSSDGCHGFFPDSMIQAAVSDKVFAKYSEALTRDALKAADINDIVNCHNCQLQVSLPIDCGIVLVCPDCRAETCRLCGEEAHIPLKCSEVEKKSETEARLKVEEAMTAARIRECPKCKTRFFKTEGCNKMVCTCNTFLCYICKKDITKQGYSHFCQTAHCDHKSCGKCKLFTNTIEDDRQAMLDAAIKKMEELKSTRSSEEEENPANPVAKVNLESILLCFLITSFPIRST